MAKIPTNTGAGTVLEWPITETDVGGLDLTTVTGVILNVRRPDGTTTSWPASIATGATSKSLTILHPFTLGDVSLVGPYILQALLVTPAGNIPVFPPRAQPVVGPFDS